MKQHEATPETPSTHLSEPHFDDIAVLIAQPVEPIEPRPNRRWGALLENLEKPPTLLAIVFISVMIGIIVLALTLQFHARTVDTAANETPIEQTTPETEPPKAPAESPQAAADTDEKKVRPRRPRASKLARVNDDDSRPKARRFGVIYYRSTSRP